MLTRIIRNLVINALRYTRSGGIHIGCRTRADSVRIEVRDTGIGIPEEHLSKIFEEFHQVDNPGRDRSKGLGLGLAIADRLTELLGATIEVWSREGSGSRFTLTLPLAQPQQQGQTTEPAAGLVPASIAGLRIVCIDDDPSIRDAMTALLESWNCDFVMAENLADIWSEIQKWQNVPDIIIADYRLRDGHTGTQVISELRRHYTAEIPAIIITGDTSPERLTDAVSSGALVLHKPIKAIKLRMMIEQIVTPEE